MKKQCVLILSYFGKFNNYFPLFLRSCAANPSYDFSDFYGFHGIIPVPLQCACGANDFGGV